MTAETVQHDSTVPNPPYTTDYWLFETPCCSSCCANDALHTGGFLTREFPRWVGPGYPLC